MSYYTPKEFNLPALAGISQKNIDEHMKLYAGYVANTNKILEQMYTHPASPDYDKKEMRRRLGFEFDGMRNHEYFFEQWQDSPQTISTDGALYKKIAEQFGTFDAWQSDFFETAKTRGIGWAILYYDTDADRLMNVWVDEQHLGHAQGLQFVLGIDMWEHAFVYDYATSEKADYIQAWYENLNWSIIERRIEK